MAAPLHLAPSTDLEGTAPGASPEDGPASTGPASDAPGFDRPGLDGPASDGPGLDGPSFDGPGFGGTAVLQLPPDVPATQALAWWANGLLNAVVAADASEDGEPILAAAGHAATAALLLLRHHAAGDGDRARLREAYCASADQVAIVRELLHPHSPAAPPAPPAATRPEATATDRLRESDPCRRANRPRHRRRRLRLIRGGR